MRITEQDVKNFAAQLRSEEKASATIEKYRREAAYFVAWLDGREAERAAAQDYKEALAQTRAPAGLNGAVAALNCLFDFLGLRSCRLKAVRIQRRMFRDEARELTEKEYRRLLSAAKGNERLLLVMETICANVEVPSISMRPTTPTQPEAPAEPETSTQSEQPAVPAPVYADVAPTAWYSEAAGYVSANGLMTGTTDGSFAPDAPMTRAMLWTVLGRLDGADVEGTGNDWYASAQLWAAGKGISDGSNPGGSTTRQELVTMLWRYVNNPAASADLAAFSDGLEVPDWATPAMQWAVSAGILEGSGGQLKPGGTATRAEVAVILMRFCENTAK